MKKPVGTRPFGRTDLSVSEVGFGAWGIGGPALAGDMPIGWGAVDDATSVRALHAAAAQGVTFFDTADVYGLGHSEALIGEAFGNRGDVVIATKVGHHVDASGTFLREYGRDYILGACEQSLKRLRRDAIDYYQLHSARVADLEDGACVEAMEALQRDGKIRYWGVSLSTYDPFPEAHFLIEHGLGHGMQIAFNVINQRARGLIEQAARHGYGLIARMPLQFGLLTGKFDAQTRFDRRDHRSLRLKPAVLARALAALESVWPLAEAYGTDPTSLSLSFVLSTPGVSTVIPGIKTPEQAVQNTANLVRLETEDLERLHTLFETHLDALLDFMREQEST